MTIQPQNNNLNYLIDPTCTNVNRLFVFSFQRFSGENNATKDYSVDGKSFFGLPVKNEEETYKKIIEMSNNNDYTTGNLLDFGYFKENYKLIAIDLSKQTKLKEPQQISFIGKLSNTLGAAILSIIKNQKKLLLNFHKILSQSYKQ